MNKHKKKSPKNDLHPRVGREIKNKTSKTPITRTIKPDAVIEAPILQRIPMPSYAYQDTTYLGRLSEPQ
jgi:hypothetical protein